MGARPDGVDSVPLRVRHVGPDDLDGYREIRLRSLAEAPDAFATRLGDAAARSDEQWRDTLAALSNAPGSGVWVAEDHTGRLVAIAATLPCTDGAVPDDDGAYEVIQVWSDPSVRRSGAGRAVMEAAMAAATPYAPAGFRLWVAVGNDGAVRFYESLGFGVDRRVPATDGTICETRMARPVRGLPDAG